MSKKPISTQQAPQALGPYSQAVKAGNTVYLSGQIPLSPKTMEPIEGDMEARICCVFDNLAALAKAAGGTVDDIVKLNVFLTDLDDFATVNEVMARYFVPPYPARAAIGVAALPKAVNIEIDAVMVLDE